MPAKHWLVEIDESLNRFAVIEEVAKEMDRRGPSLSTTRLALTDGERALPIRVDQNEGRASQAS